MSRCDVGSARARGSTPPRLPGRPDRWHVRTHSARPEQHTSYAVVKLHVLDIAVITIGIPPEIQVGPIALAWHGITIAVGIALGSFVASHWLSVVAWTRNRCTR